MLVLPGSREQCGTGKESDANEIGLAGDEGLDVDVRELQMAAESARVQVQQADREQQLQADGEPLRAPLPDQQQAVPAAELAAIQ